MKIFLSTIGLLLITQVALNAESPKFQTSSGNSHCFKSREMMYPLEETFDALKQTLMQSNLNIATVTKSDGVLTAKGNQYNPDEDTIIGVTLTVDFKAREKEKTSVKVIASYETIAKKSDTGQIGGAGITLPIPVPFTGRYTLVGQGSIDDSAWYRGFFNSLEKILFENHMKYSHIKKEVAPIAVTIIETAKIIEPKIETIPVIEPQSLLPPKEEQIVPPVQVEEIKNQAPTELEKTVETQNTGQPAQVATDVTEVKTETIAEPTMKNNPQ